MLALGLAGALATLNPAALPWACPQLLTWIPFVVLGTRQRPPPVALPVPQPDLDKLRALARGFWAQYEASGGQSRRFRRRTWPWGSWRR